MSIPKYDEMYSECLTFLSDKIPHKLSEIRDSLAESFHISEDERKILLPSGKQPLFNNRVNWTCTYLKQAGLIENTSRGIYQLTSSGIQVLVNKPQTIDNTFLSKFNSFQDFFLRSNSTEAITTENANQPIHFPQTIENSQTPQDILESAYIQINSALIEDILSEIMNQSPIFFEHLVVQLLTKMGYGGSLDDSATVTKISGDEGIDGIIREDKLGFSSIYIQAKRWDRNNTVGRPELQKFVGALAGQGANKGLFITTAGFTKEAREYVHKHLGAKIVLIDGNSLAKLMIEYNVGVSTVSAYYIKKIDSDFFDDSLL